MFRMLFQTLCLSLADSVTSAVSVTEGDVSKLARPQRLELDLKWAPICRYPHSSLFLCVDGKYSLKTVKFHYFGGGGDNRSAIFCFSKASLSLHI